MHQIPEMRDQCEFKNDHFELLSNYVLKVDNQLDTLDTCVSFIIVTIKNWLCYHPNRRIFSFNFALNHETQKHRFSNLKLVTRDQGGDSFYQYILDLEIFWEHITDVESLLIMNRVMMHFATLYRDTYAKERK